MRPEKHQLLDDLLDDGSAEARRRAALLAGTTALRRRRWRRVMVRSCVAGAAIMAVLAVVNPRNLPHFRTVPTTSTAPTGQEAAPKAVVRVEFITDDQLLALFPGTPVGLGTAGGKTRLLFPRAGDEARFVIRLAGAAADRADRAGAN